MVPEKSVQTRPRLLTNVRTQVVAREYDKVNEDFDFQGN